VHTGEATNLPTRIKTLLSLVHLVRLVGKGKIGKVDICIVVCYAFVWFITIYVLIRLLDSPLKGYRLQGEHQATMGGKASLVGRTFTTRSPV
jgi:hypothetical protein